MKTENKKEEKSSERLSAVRCSVERPENLYKLPTGYLFYDEYSKGKLETLSIGDYGKSKNVKANFLGLDKEINGVPNGEILPLSEKWVVTLSTQYGCPMKCNFCDVSKLGYHGNATYGDLKSQLYKAINLYDVKYTERLNIHFARMGEPAFNYGAIKDFTQWLAHNKKDFQNETGLRAEVIHPVFTTSMPKDSKYLREHILSWSWMKNETYNGQAGLQISINSTDETKRNEMFNNHQLTLEEISKIGEILPNPISRKYCLNFAYSSDYIIDAQKLRKLFSPEKFMCKITPIHNNQSCKENKIQTIDGYESYQPYKQVENDLIDAGFDVLVFIPSMDEEKGLITCGNAILSGSTIEC